MQICKYFGPIPNLFKEIYLRESSAFLMRIFVVFLLLTDPASRKANPACITVNNKHQHTVIILKIGAVKVITFIVLNCMGRRVGTDFCIKKPTRDKQLHVQEKQYDSSCRLRPDFTSKLVH